jgi:hypothetical protein
MQHAWDKERSEIFIHRYLDDQAVKPPWRRDFPVQSRPVTISTHIPAKSVLGLFSGVNLPERGADHTPF